MKNINLLFVFFLMIGNLNAQRLINPKEEETDLFSEEQKETFEQFRSNTQDIKWIQLDRIEGSIDEEGYINFQLPDSGDSYRMKITRSEVEDENNYTYSAQSQDEEGEPTGDDLILVNAGGYISGTVQVGGDLFRIIPISSETQILVKSGLETPNWCDTKDIESELPNIGECAMGSDGCLIKIMYVVDSDKETIKFLSKNAIISQCKLWTEDINTTLKNSEVKHKFQLVWVEFLTDPMPFKDGDCSLSKDAFKTTYMTNTTSTVAMAKQQSEADIVIFLTTRNSLFAKCELGGSAFALAPKKPENAFAVVNLDAAMKWFTVTHEVGHLLGGLHEDGVSPAQAHQFSVKGNLTNTMMHTDKINGTRVKYFSNPKVTINKTPTGTNDRNNACVIQNQGCITSKLVADDKCTLTLNGIFDKTCSPTKIDLSVASNVPLNCLKSANYLFEYSTDGKTFKTAYSGSNPKCTVKLTPNTKNYTVFVRVTVFNSTSPLASDKVYGSFDIRGCKS